MFPKNLWKYEAEGYDAQGYSHIYTAGNNITHITRLIHELYPKVVLIILWHRERLSGLKGGAPICGVKRLAKVVILSESRISGMHQIK
jgi:hypothetical protein